MSVTAAAVAAGLGATGVAPPDETGRPTDSAKPRRAVHIPALDGLRGIAILLVLVFHFSQAAYDPRATGLRALLQKLTGSGWAGVDLFFVLSGFLITSILYEAKHSAGYFKNFYMRRVLRIFPLYYGVLVAAFVVIPLFHPYQTRVYRNIAAHQGYLWAYLQNFVRIEWKGFTHFWSLAVEEQFYLVWPAVVFLLHRKTLMRVCGTVMVAALTLRVVLVTRHYDPQAVYYWTPCRMDTLAVGAFLALAAHGRNGIAAFAKPAAVGTGLTGVALVGLFAWKRGFWFGNPAVQTVGYTLLALFCGCLLVRAVAARAAGPWGRVCNSVGLRFFGKYSYGIYVFHGLLVPWLAAALPVPRLAGRLHSFYLAWAVHLIVGTLASLALALVSWHLYEKHFLKLKRFFEYRATTLREPVRDDWVPPAEPDSAKSQDLPRPAVG